MKLILFCWINMKKTPAFKLGGIKCIKHYIFDTISPDFICRYWATIFILYQKLASSQCYLSTLCDDSCEWNVNYLMDFLFIYLNKNAAFTSQKSEEKNYIKIDGKELKENWPSHRLCSLTEIIFISILFFFDHEYNIN